jgi:hypothetical protein
MKTGKCIGCKKALKPGEFVVLNGGAMIKTKTGAVMGDKKHLGFLTVQTHFDFKKNYRSLTIVDKAPNGQFEFYACSHKCLANFMSKQIMFLDKLDKAVKGKKIVMAPQTKVEEIGLAHCLKVVRMMGFKNALITDESTVGDFSDGTQGFIDKLNKKFPFPFKVEESDFIWEVAKLHCLFLKP